jgi:hypothetical protein
MSAKWGYVSELQPPAGLLFISQMMFEFGEPRWNDNDWGHRKSSEKNTSLCHFFPQILHGLTQSWTRASMVTYSGRILIEEGPALHVSRSTPPQTFVRHSVCGIMCLTVVSENQLGSSTEEQETQCYSFKAIRMKIRISGDEHRNTGRGSWRSQILPPILFLIYLLTAALTHGTVDIIVLVIQCEIKLVM